MSTELVDIQAQIAAELANLDKTLAPPGGHKVSLKGKTFTFPDGKTSPGPISCVILDYRNVNKYYKGAYNPKQLESPTCFAQSKEIAGMAPSVNADDPQSKGCDECPWNEWGSAPGGGRGKACKNQVRIAVVPPDASADTPPWTIELAPSSVSAFTGFTNAVGNGLGLLPMQVQVALDFDQNESYPKVTFGDVEPLPEDKIALMFQLREAAQLLLDAEPEKAG